MSIRTKILDKGKIVQEQLIRTLLKFDSRISALEKGDTTESSYDDTEVRGLITALDERVTALENTPTQE